jgi:hypothetical protein
MLYLSVWSLTPFFIQMPTYIFFFLLFAWLGYVLNRLNASFPLPPMWCGNIAMLILLVMSILGVNFILGDGEGNLIRQVKASAYFKSAFTCAAAWFIARIIFKKLSKDKKSSEKL